MTKNITIQQGSDNIFDYLTLPNPNEMLVKAELTRQINSILKERNLTDIKTKQLLNLDRDRLFSLQQGKNACY